MYLNTTANCDKKSSVMIITSGQNGTGFTGTPTLTVQTANGDTGYGCLCQASMGGGSIVAVSMLAFGQDYTQLPTVIVSGGGNPGIITGYSALNGGSVYALPPTLTITGGGANSTGFIGSTTLTATSVSSTFTITNGGTGYAVNDVLNFDYTGTGGGSGVVAKVLTVSSGVITGITLTSAGSGFTLKPPTISSITSTSGSGAVITCSLVPTSVGSLVITNGGKNNALTPTFVFTPVSGGTGASATPTLNLGTSPIFTIYFYKTMSYTWNNIPPLIINDLARLSAINIVQTSFNVNTIYTYRIKGLQYDSRNSFFSDYGDPILSMAQNVNVCSYGSLGGTPFAIILTPQTINSITITVDDNIVYKNSGQAMATAFCIALEIEEFDPTITQIGDPYNESISRLKNGY
jgi:hypothetical protein